jgi:hypothetical protein
MQPSLKRKLAFGTAALAATAFGGGAYAAAQDSGTNSRQAFLNDVAKRLKVTPTELTAALQGAFSDQLAAAVAAGKLTQAQADQIKQHGGAPFGGFVAPGGIGGGRFFGSKGPGRLGGPFGGGLDAAASYLGLTPLALRDQLDAGMSLAQVATARHKPVSGLKGAIVAAIRTGLDKAVAAKQLTSAEEQRIVSRLSARLDGLVDHTGFTPRFGPRGPLGHTGKGASLPEAPPSPPQAGSAPPTPGLVAPGPPTYQ